MKKLTVIYLIVYPYLFILFTALFFFLLNAMPKYGGDIFFLSLGLNIVISSILLILYFICSILLVLYSSSVSKYKVEQEELIKINMIIKLSHIVAHIIIFLLGLILVSLLFTIGFAMAIIALQYIILVVSSIIGVTSLLKNNYDSNRKVIFALLQFIYVVDVIIAILIYKEYKNKLEVEDEIDKCIELETNISN